MPHRIIKALLLSAACAFLASCKDTIEIDLPAGEEYIVISGRIADENLSQPIRITRSFSMASTGRPQAVRGARVKVTDSEGHTYNYMEDNDGVYRAAPNFKGMTGIEYTLEVAVDTDGDNIDEIFTASDIMCEPARIERIKFEKYRFLSKDLIMIVVWAQLPENSNNAGYCFNVTIGNPDDLESYSDMALFKDDFLDKRTIDSLAMFYVDPNDKNNKYKFDVGNMVEVKVLSPSKQYYEFLRESKENISSDIPIYGGPPANSSTNIRQRGGTPTPVTGFFAACPYDWSYLPIWESTLE